MPGPAAPLVPVLLSPAAIASAKAWASMVASDYGALISSFSLATVLARQAWKRLPSWVKQDEAFRSMVSTDDSGPEVLSLTAVVEKLQTLVAFGLEKIHEDHPGRKFHYQAAFLCYLQLAMQLRIRNPEVSSRLYHCLEDDDDDAMAKLIKEDNDMVSQPSYWREIRQALDFAMFAYEEDTVKLRTKLEALDFFLINHSLTTKMPPGFVGYYAAISPEQKVLLIGVKGTSTLEDLLTDCCGIATPFVLEDTPFDDQALQKNEDILVVDDNDDTSGEETEKASSVEVQYYDGVKVHCHEGILIAARRLVSQVMDIVEQLTKSGYRVLLCGHSLGAGTACLMAMVLQSRLPHLKEANKLHVYAFGCPPVLDLDAAEACAPFITAVVNGSDLIARSSLANLRTFLDFLRIIHDKYLDPAGLTPTNPKRTIDLIRKLCQGLDTDLVMSQPQVSAEIAVAQTRILLHDPQHLYIPGMVLLLSASSAPKEPVSDNSKHTKYECVVTTGSTHVLRFFDIGKGVEMVTDHLTTTYGERIDALIQRLHGNIENL